MGMQATAQNGTIVIKILPNQLNVIGSPSPNITSQDIASGGIKRNEQKPASFTIFIRDYPFSIGEIFVVKPSGA